jgi:hypothetical protein
MMTKIILKLAFYWKISFLININFINITNLLIYFKFYHYYYSCIKSTSNDIYEMEAKLRNSKGIQPVLYLNKQTNIFCIMHVYIILGLKIFCLHFDLTPPPPHTEM